MTEGQMSHIRLLFFWPSNTMSHLSVQINPEKFMIPEKKICLVLLWPS